MLTTDETGLMTILGGADCARPHRLSKEPLMLKNYDRLTSHLSRIKKDFYGRVIIRVRDGKAVMITEERDTRLDDDDVEKGSPDAHTN